MQLGFLGLKAQLGSLRCAVSWRHLHFSEFVCLGKIAMGSNRLLASSSVVPPDSTQKSTRKLRSNRQNSIQSVAKEDDAREMTDVQSVRDDPEKVESMTVLQLRSKLRSVGLPTKGCKRDLVVAFKSFLENRIIGPNHEIANEQFSSEMEFTCTGDTSSKSLAIKSPVKADAKVPDKEFGLNRIKRKENRDCAGISTVQINGKVGRTKGKLSNETDELSGTMPSKAKRKKSCEAGGEGVGSVDGIVLSMNRDEPWTVLAHKKPQKEWRPYNPKVMRPPPLTSDTEYVKLMSWNVNGLRALLKMDASSALQLAQREDFDILCLQETKLQEKDVEAIKQRLIDGYENSFWTCSVSKLGYSGTSIISRIKPLFVTYGLGITDHDSEGRLVTAEFDRFYLLCAYVPNSGDGLKRLSYRVTQWDPSLSSYIKELEKLKPVILTGDLNCAHEEIDIYNPAGNKRSAGFTDEERESFGTNFLSRGLVDTFRKQHPGVVGYTYWGYRHGGRKTNKGWRLDYFLVSESMADKVHDSFILPDISGSDHSPIGLVLKL